MKCRSKKKKIWKEKAAFSKRKYKVLNLHKAIASFLRKSPFCDVILCVKTRMSSATDVTLNTRPPSVSRL